MKSRYTGDLAIRYRRFMGRIGHFFAELGRQCAPFLLAAALVLVWCGVIYKKAAPRAAEVARTVAMGTLEKEITAAAVDAVAGIAPDDFCRVEYGRDGEILAVSADASAVSAAQKAVLDAVNRRLGEISYIPVRLPVGTLLGGQLLSGRGFRLTVRAEPYCNLSTDVESRLESAGINQVSHTIILTVHADVTLICMGQNDRFETDVSLPLAESILVGSVPDGFFGMGGVSENPAP